MDGNNYKVAKVNVANKIDKINRIKEILLIMERVEKHFLNQDIFTFKGKYIDGDIMLFGSFTTEIFKYGKIEIGIPDSIDHYLTMYNFHHNKVHPKIRTINKIKKDCVFLDGLRSDYDLCYEISTILDKANGSR